MLSAQNSVFILDHHANISFGIEALEVHKKSFLSIINLFLYVDIAQNLTTR